MKAPICQLVRVALLSLLVISPVGCSSVDCADCADCIPWSKMPYAVYDGGVKYYLTDHASIGDMIASNWLEDNMRVQLIETLKQKFPNDHDLTAYLETTQKRAERFEKSYSRFLRGMEKDQKQSGGELYKYKILGKKGDMGGGQVGIGSEDGLLILSKGKVIKKYVEGFGGLEDEGVLKQQRLRPP